MMTAHGGILTKSNSKSIDKWKNSRASVIRKCTINDCLGNPALGASWYRILNSSLSCTNAWWFATYFTRVFLRFSLRVNCFRIILVRLSFTVFIKWLTAVALEEYPTHAKQTVAEESVHQQPTRSPQKDYARHQYITIKKLQLNLLEIDRSNDRLLKPQTGEI